MRRPVEEIPCERCPLSGCKGLKPHETEEIATIQAFKKGEVLIERGETLIEQSVTKGKLYTLLDGVLMRYRSLTDGRRQIVNFMFPGDLVGLQASFGDTASHSVEALLPSRLCEFEQASFRDLITSKPDFAYDITWLAAKEETALEEHLVALGRRSAQERVAYLAIWLIRRARATCLAAQGNRLDVSITQTQIADMLGLSLVHTNRTIKALERAGHVTWRTSFIAVPDLEAASKFAKFDNSEEKLRPYI